MQYLSAWMYMVIVGWVLLTVLILGIYALVFHRSFVMKALGAIWIAMVFFLASDRDMYLPFLGEMVFPKSLLNPSIPKDATQSVRVEIPNAVDGTPVVYWAAEESASGPLPDPWKAYSQYENAGVALVQMGIADLKVRPPSAYYVPSGRLLKRHVHYRVLQENGMLSSVKTAYVI